MDTATLDRVATPVIVIDGHGRATHMNAECARRTGRPPAAAALWDLVPPEESEALRAALAALPEDVPDHLEVALLTASGATGPLLWTVTAARGEDGRIAHAVLTGTDLAALRGAEQAAREAGRWKELVERAAWGVVVGSPDGRLIDMNPAFARMHGWEVHELVGRPVAEVFAPHRRDQLAERTRIVHERRAVLWESEHVRRDGTTFPVAIDSTTVRDEEGQVAYRAVYVQDITERKRMESARAESEAMFRSIVSVSSDAIVTVDEDQRIVLFNQGAERIFGWTSAEALGQPLDRLIPAALRTAHREDLARFGENGVSARAMAGRRMVRALRRDGREFPAQCAISRVEIGGSRLFTAVLRDMTDVVRRLDEKRFLAEASAVLAASLEVEATLIEVGRLAVRHLADVCIIDLVREHGVQRLRVLARQADREPLAEALEQVALERDRPHLVAKVLETQQPQLIEEVAPSFLESVAQSEDHLRLLQAIGPRSMLGLPLLARGRLHGAIVLLSTERPHDDQDLDVGVQLADRAAMALDNAHLHQALAHANAELRATIGDLAAAQARIRTLTGLLPLCAWCGKIRASEGAWVSLEDFLAAHTTAQLSHGICGDCRGRHFPRPE